MSRVYLGDEGSERCKTVSQVGGALITAQGIHQHPKDTSQQVVFTVQGGACLGVGWGGVEEQHH